MNIDHYLEHASIADKTVNDEHIDPQASLVESKRFHCDVGRHDRHIEADEKHAPFTREEVVVHRDKYHSCDEECEQPHSAHEQGVGEMQLVGLTIAVDDIRAGNADA